MSEHNGKKVSTFRERFTELCDSNPKNDSAIAAELHVSRQTVHYWKLGDRSPKTPTIIAIANYFGVDVAWLMGFDVQKYQDEEFVQEYIRRYKEMFPNAQNNAPISREARIISQTVDKMPKEKREQALQLFRIAFPDYAEEE